MEPSPLAFLWEPEGEACDSYASMTLLVLSEVSIHAQVVEYQEKKYLLDQGSTSGASWGILIFHI